MHDPPRSPLRPLLWKELREVAPWFLAALVAATGCLVASFLIDDRPLGLGDEEVRGFFLLGNVASALLLALPAFGRVLTKDGWGLLLQRPASRRVTLAVKLGVGLGAYFFSQAVPLLAVAWWSSIPGNLAGPFFAAFALPPLVDLAAGAAVYLAAALVLVREARWFGSRLLWVPALILALTIAYAVPELWQALLAYALTLTVLAIALAGCWSGRDRVANGIRGPGWWATAAALGFGLLGVGGVLVGIGAAAAAWGQGAAGHLSWTVLQDGRVVLQDRRGIDSGVFYANVEAYEANQRLSPPPSKLEEAAHGGFRTYENGWEPGWRSPEHAVEQIWFGSDLNWFHLVERRIFLGYDPFTRRPEAAFGGSGFTDPSAARPLPPDARQLERRSLLINRPDGLWGVDLADRVQRKLADASVLGGPAIHHAEFYKNSPGRDGIAGEGFRALTVTTSPTRLIVQAQPKDPDDPREVRLSMPLPDDRLSGAVYTTDESFKFLVSQGWEPGVRMWNPRERLWEVDPSGTVTREDTLRDPPALQLNHGYLAYVVPVPPTVLIAIRWTIDASSVTFTPNAGSAAAFLLALLAWPALAGGLQLRRDGRCTPAVAGWALAGFLLGLLALPLRGVMLKRQLPPPEAPPAPGPTAPLIRPLPA